MAGAAVPSNETCIGSPFMAPRPTGFITGNHDLRAQHDITATDRYHLTERVQIFCSHGNLTGINRDSP
jgi:hypothetical protein